MSGGRFLVSEKDITTSEKIIKIKTLVKQGFVIDSNILKAEEDPVQIAKLMNDVGELIGEADTLQLDEASRQVSDNIAGYIVHEIEILQRLLPTQASICPAKNGVSRPSNSWRI